MWNVTGGPHRKSDHGILDRMALWVPPPAARAPSGGGTPVLIDTRAGREEAGMTSLGCGVSRSELPGPLLQGPCPEAPTGSRMPSEGSKEKRSQCHKDLPTLSTWPSCWDHLCGWAGLKPPLRKGANLALLPRPCVNHQWGWEPGVLRTNICWNSLLRGRWHVLSGPPYLEAEV